MNHAENFSQFKAGYDRDGFVVVRQFLNENELNQLRDNLERYIREIVPTLPPSEAFYQDRGKSETLKQMQHMSRDPFFREYTRHPKWLSLAESLVGEPVSCDAPEWFNKPPGTQHATPPHQDNFYFCLTPPDVTTVWLALDDVDDDNGCLCYVRASHLQGIRPHGASSIVGFSQQLLDYSAGDAAAEVRVHLRPGDAVAHHSNTIHRADANRTQDRQRRAFAMVYRGVSCRRDEEAFARYQQSLKAQHTELGL